MPTPEVGVDPMRAPLDWEHAIWLVWNWGVPISLAYLASRTLEP